jgi:hypothetical protein
VGDILSLADDCAEKARALMCTWRKGHYNCLRHSQAAGITIEDRTFLAAVCTAWFRFRAIVAYVRCEATFQHHQAICKWHICRPWRMLQFLDIRKCWKRRVRTSALNGRTAVVTVWLVAWLRAGRSGFCSRQGQNFSHLNSVQADFEAHPVS